ncbi:hypothetical protein YC2023_015446 [Brassica napus]
MSITPKIRIIRTETERTTECPGLVKTEEDVDKKKRVKTEESPLIQSFLFAIVKGSVQLEGAKMHESFMLYKSEEVEVKKISSHRKLMFHSTTDYDDAGANPKHDPRRRPGGKP